MSDTNLQRAAALDTATTGDAMDKLEIAGAGVVLDNAGREDDMLAAAEQIAGAEARIRELERT